MLPCLGMVDERGSPNGEGLKSTPQFPTHGQVSSISMPFGPRSASSASVHVVFRASQTYIQSISHQLKVRSIPCLRIPNVCCRLGFHPNPHPPCLGPFEWPPLLLGSPLDLGPPTCEASQGKGHGSGQAGQAGGCASGRMEEFLDQTGSAWIRSIFLQECPTYITAKTSLMPLSN